MQGTRSAVEAVWRIDSPRLIAGLARYVRDVGLAEDLAQDALVAALEAWPSSGVPPNPGAWLMVTAKHKAIDHLRRATRLQEKVGEITRDLTETVSPAADTDIGDEIGDDLLTLVFTCCHPVLPREARVALTLRMLGGLRTEEIARAFLVPSATMGQRINRAKKALATAGVAFEAPAGAEIAERLPAVLEVVYLIFNEGYSATAGQDWMRPELCQDAMRLGRILAAITPGEPEVHGLIALLEILASRLRARTGPDGAPVLLLEQNRGRWDHLLIGRGLAALERARALRRPPGRYLLQAEIAACHARARTAAETDWTRIAGLYAELARVVPSPVIELNRAVAVGMADGPRAALALVDVLVAGGALAGYHLLPSVRGDLLAKLGRGGEAAEEFRRAASLTGNEREQRLLRDRAAAC